ncbi:MAG TPA: hypothetical protein VIS52_04000 [Motiliproteus sp.]
MLAVLGIVAASWGLGGTLAILGWAVYRLGLIGLETFSHTLSWYHWVVLVVWVLFMAHSEGYKGFQRGFSPRVAARIAYLKQHPTLLRTLLAPLFCMGFFGIQRRRQIVTFCLTLGIIGLVQLVSMLTQPWRGIVDIGVVVGLAWGIVSLAIFTAQAFTDASFNHSPQMPDSAS